MCEQTVRGQQATAKKPAKAEDRILTTVLGVPATSAGWDFVELLCVRKISLKCPRNSQSVSAENSRGRQEEAEQRRVESGVERAQANIDHSYQTGLRPLRTSVCAVVNGKRWKKLPISVSEEGSHREEANGRPVPGHYAFPSQVAINTTNL